MAEDHPLAVHFLERLDEPFVRLLFSDQLGQFGDCDAVVAHPLEMQVRVEQREHEPQVDRDVPFREIVTGTQRDR